MGSTFRWLILIMILSAFSLWVAVPDTKITNVDDLCYDSPEDVPAQGIYLDFNNDCEADFSLNVQDRRGLDLVGGLRVLLEVELPPGSYTLEDLNEAANNISRRVNGLGLTEATVQVQGNDRILVELPGVTDRQQAINTIQQTALLEFVDFGGLSGQAQRLIGQKILTTEQLLIQEQRQSVPSLPEVTPEATAEATESAGTTFDSAPEATPELTPEASTETPEDTTTDEAPRLLNPLTGQPFETVITGAALQAAAAQYSVQEGWFIQFELKPEGAAVFGPFTASRIGEPLAIVLDGEVLSAPRINDTLTDGGVIQGGFTEQEAKQLALQLRSGSLPIPLRVESAQEVGATLGQESVRLSIRAGIIGVLVILTFMLIYYRVPGIAADLALMVFVLLNIMFFKLIPVTLTLPAITGFLISIGTAVDGNILIFERIKEELRAGNTIDKALDAGFDRAWNSIRDSNTSTIIICFILFLFGQTPGASIVSGFAITLGLGLVLNLFTAVIVTRTFLTILVKLTEKTLAQRQWLLGI